jgi:pimeloyl-ACP methyl ester carboxylesterase
MERLDVSFKSQGQRCDAWLYLPEGEGPHPCVVVAHGMGGIRQVRLGAYGERFARAGYATLAFDYRHWGTSEGSPRYVCSLKRQQADINAAIDFVLGRKDIDSGRVALFGTSFGGGHTVVVASKRRDLMAVITQGAFLDGRLVVPKNVPTFALALGLATAWTVDQLRTFVGLAPKYMKIVGQPGELALLTHAGDEDGYNAMLDGPSAWANKVAARVRNSVPFFRPIKHAHAITTPLLAIICDRDEACPPSLSVQAAKLAPHGQVVHFDAAHFEIYFGELFEGATQAMVTFLDAVGAANGQTVRPSVRAENQRRSQTQLAAAAAAH